LSKRGKSLKMEKELLDRLDRLIIALTHLAPPAPSVPDWQAPAFRWRKRNGRGFLQAVQYPHEIALTDLHHISPQKEAVYTNTRQFVAGRPANNVLLTGARGTGKSSLVKAAFHAFKDQGLRLIEIDKADLIDLADIVELIANRPERFIIFCDDLSFDEGEVNYRALKTALDGSISATSANLLIYATSNRRHLVPEYHRDNHATHPINDEIHPGEAVEEKISLSERFGLWLTFYTFDQQAYLTTAQHWLQYLGIHTWNEAVEKAALQWALMRGARSGRIAWQFARDWAGKQEH
jgi:predicted AAA+ superfamily ATPase